MYPQSFSPAQQVDFALLLIFIFAAAMLVILAGTGAWFTWRYHHTRNPVPSDIRGNKTAEIIWTIIPTLMVMGLFYYGWTGFKALRTVPEGAMEVRVAAKMFSWTFTYPGGKQSRELIVPVNTPVKVKLTAVDVIHGFFVPAFRIKMDCVPGMENYAWFSADKEGIYDIYCAEYCGTGHADMLSVVRAVSKNDFDAWLADAGPVGGPEAGRAFMDAQGCFGCHAVDGTSLNGPPLNRLYDKSVMLSVHGKDREITADENYLKDAITDPGKDLVKGWDNIMPPYADVTPEQMRNMLDYMKSIAESGAPSEGPPAKDVPGLPEAPKTQDTPPAGQGRPVNGTADPHAGHGAGKSND